MLKSLKGLFHLIVYELNEGGWNAFAISMRRCRRKEVLFFMNPWGGGEKGDETQKERKKEKVIIIVLISIFITVS